MTQDSGGLSSWGRGALSILSSGGSRPVLGPEGETQKYQSLRALRDHQSYSTHVREEETGLGRGDDVPELSRQESSRTRLKAWSPESSVG